MTRTLDLARNGASTDAEVSTSPCVGDTTNPEALSATLPCVHRS